MIYQTFAQLYDELFDPEEYQNWLDYTNSRVHGKNLKWLELACGTGHLAINLLKQGQDVTGFDLSEEMLSLAENHAVEEGVDLPLIQGNMLDLSGLEQYQVVSCYADSFCYLPSLNEVQEAFQQVAQHLKKDGQFIFDVITPYQTDEVYPGYMFNYQDEDKSFLWSSFGVDDGHRVEHDLTFFIKNKEGLFDKVNELHTETTYELAEYLDALKQAGFTQIEVTTNFGESTPNDTSTRWFFNCRR
ncbi:class I SAM-dependent methyltransferase [Pediococcus argentinicus]|uniref:class I SAM-dependent DNA methyltransferase n=1 Tax=Pediococcus argentinicus TaxID=480391 RepID=UPI00338F5F87